MYQNKLPTTWSLPCTTSGIFKWTGDFTKQLVTLSGITWLHSEAVFVVKQFFGLCFVVAVKLSYAQLFVRKKWRKRSLFITLSKLVGKSNVVMRFCFWKATHERDMKVSNGNFSLSVIETNANLKIKWEKQRWATFWYQKYYPLRICFSKTINQASNLFKFGEIYGIEFILSLFLPVFSFLLLHLFLPSYFTSVAGQHCCRLIDLLFPSPIQWWD